MSRTNIDLDDEALEIVMKRYGFTTKKEAVDYALRALAGVPSSFEEIAEMRGAHLIEFDVEDRFDHDR